ncbi:N-formyl peptide receptor 3-like [Ambystoma mexicanum]|uniref:N-formyl peptide receptor 3-like n=1 Tax=Ambystoma mexicanum TaxID=8296 RepID=UPI0037E9181F
MENATDISDYFLINSMIFGSGESITEEHYQSPHLFTYLMFFSLVSHSITFLLGVAGNGLVIWVGTFKMSKTVNIIWFLNLALADFIFDLFLPFHIVSLAMNEHWPFGSVLCKISNMVLSLNMLASISFLMIISMDRCVSVLSPIWSRKHRTPRLAYKVAFAAWVVAIIFSSPYPAFYDITPASVSEYNTYCFLSYAVPYEDVSKEAFHTMNKRHMIMAITRFVSMFLVPFAIIISCYVAIALKIKNRRHRSTSSRPFKIIIAIVVLFFICWFPFHAVPFLEYVYNDSSWLFTFQIVANTLATSLAYSNSCLNPILYVFMGKQFKDIFRRSLLSVFRMAFNEDPTMEALDSMSPSKSCDVDSHLC